MVGTQSLLSDNLKYANLGLLIVDEEQRFGVESKIKLVNKYIDIDVLTLTATPIPRTLKQAMDGLIDISTLDTPPVQRKPVIIETIQPGKTGIERAHSDSESTSGNYRKAARKVGKIYVDFDVMAEGIRRELARGGQCFVICPHIDNLSIYVGELITRIPELRINTVHGGMGDIEEQVEDFAEGGADILLATTVIENGINLPKVNAIFICEAER